MIRLLRHVFFKYLTRFISLNSILYEIINIYSNDYISINGSKSKYLEFYIVLGISIHVSKM